jgi:hypothetical protein
VPGDSDRVWFVARGRGTYGPFTDDGFAQLASSGRLGLADYVWYSGLSNWVLCEQLCAQQAYSNVPGRGAPVPSSPKIARQGRPLHNPTVLQHDARFLGAVVPAALLRGQQDALVGLHAASELQTNVAESSPLRTTLRTASHMVAGRAFPPAAAIKTRSAPAATAVVPAVLMRAFGGLSDLLTRSAAFVRGRVDQRLLRRTSSFYFRVLVLLPLMSVALWWLTFYGRAFWPESGTLARKTPDAVADTTKATELTASPRAGAGISKMAASKEADKFRAPAKSKTVAKTNPVPKQPAAKAVTQDTTSEWVRQVFGN